MPRKQILYNTAEQVLDELITARQTLKNMQLKRWRAYNLYHDLVQFEIINTGIRLYRASKQITDIDI